MLPKKNKLNLARASAREIFNNSQKIYGNHFISFYRLLELEGEENFKAAVVIPKKHVKKAVGRNSVRRKVFQTIEEEIFKNKELFKKIGQKKLELVVLLKKPLDSGWEENLKRDLKQIVSCLK